MSGGETFAGFVMTGDVPGGRAGAELSVVPGGVAARTRDHGEFRLPFLEASFDRGGATGKMTFVRSRLSDLIVGTEDPRFVAALRENADAATLARLEEALAGARARSSAATRNGWKLFFGLAGLATLGFFVLITLARSAITGLPRSVDRTLGNEAYAELKPSLVFDPNPVVDAALRRIADRLAPHADLRDFDLDVIDVDSDVVNAMALPGGKLMIHRGLVRILAAPDELAAVMAHEIAHVTERHGMQRIAERVGTVTLLRAYFGDAGALIEALGELAGDLASLGWSRDDEAEADREAVRMCAAAGIDPLALERAFSRMQEATRDAPEIPKWFSSHPPTGDRREAVRVAAAEQTVVDPRPLDVDWAAVQAAVAD